LNGDEHEDPALIVQEQDKNDDAGSMSMPPPDTTVKGKQTSSFLRNKWLGVFWTTELWKTTYPTGPAPPKKVCVFLDVMFVAAVTRY
jgi:hypothetical protein